MKRLCAAAILWCGLWLPPAHGGLEGDMATHMAVQLPLLAAVGVLLVPAVSSYEPRWLAEADWLGIPGLVLVLFSTSYWMLPLALDGALSDWRTEVAKFLSLPLAVGLPLGLSWRRMPPVGRGFVVANVISKLAAAGGLYLAAPVRLCAYYRLDQQAEAGWVLLGIAVALALGAFLIVFCGWSWPPSADPSQPGGKPRWQLG